MCRLVNAERPSGRRAVVVSQAGDLVSSGFDPGEPSRVSEACLQGEIARSGEEACL